MPDLPILELLQDCQDPPATRESLARLQARLGVRFPDEYAEFLLQFNGGYFPHPVKCYLPEPSEQCQSTDVREFYGDPGNPDEESRLVDVAEMNQGEIPEGYLSVAFSFGGDDVVLNVDNSSEGYGSVWLWNNCSWETDLCELNRLADSFNEFLGMLQYDMDFDREDQETIPIFSTVEYGNLRAVEQILINGVSVDSRNDDERTLLMAAVIYQWPKIVRLLLDHRANPNARDRNGRTALHYAAGHSYDSAKLLLAAGADARLRDNTRKGVLAGWSWRLDQLLRAHGAEE